MDWLLTILILLPLAAAILTAASPKATAKMAGIVGAALTFLASLPLLLSAHATPGRGFIYEQNLNWLPALGIHYHVGVDGAAASLVLLTTFLSVCAAVYSAEKVTDRTNHFLALLLVMEAATIGAFVSLDLILFYLFFEVCLVPVYFMIGIWGGQGSDEKAIRRRVVAANRFFLYTVVGSLLMLAAIITVYLRTGSFQFADVRTAFATSNLGASPEALWIFVGFAIAFAVKTGVFPFHSWLPDAYAESPTGTVVLLSGAMAKLGTYGFFRFCLGLFPYASYKMAPALVTLGVISIIYGALVAAVQRDAKRVIAYSSISHLGFVVLGLFSLAEPSMQGALLQQINHGITAGILFLIVGMIQDRRGTTYIRELGGLWEQMPLFGRIFLIATLSSVGLPLTNGFIGEFQILLGTTQSFPIAGALATTGVIWSAVYMLWMFQRVMYGPVSNPANRRLRDISGVEIGVLVPFVVLIFFLGLYPKYATETLTPSMQQTLDPIHHLPPAGGAPRRGR